MIKMLMVSIKNKYFLVLLSLGVFILTTANANACQVIERFENKDSQDNWQMMEISGVNHKALKDEVCRIEGVHAKNDIIELVFIPNNYEGDSPVLVFKLNNCRFNVYLTPSKDRTTRTVSSDYESACGEKKAGDFSMFSGSPKDMGSYYYYSASCKSGGSAFVNVQKNSPNVFCWRGNTSSGCEAGIGVDEAMRRGCSGN